MIDTLSGTTNDFAPFGTSVTTVATKAALNAGIAAAVQNYVTAANTYDAGNITSELKIAYNKFFNCNINDNEYKNLQNHELSTVFDNISCKFIHDFTNVSLSNDNKKFRINIIDKFALVLKTIGNKEYIVIPYKQEQRKLERTGNAVAFTAAATTFSNFIVDEVKDNLLKSIPSRVSDTLKGTDFSPEAAALSTTAAAIVAVGISGGMVKIVQKITKNLNEKQNEILMNTFLKPMNLLCIFLTQEITNKTETIQNSLKNENDFITDKFNEYYLTPSGNKIKSNMENCNDDITNYIDEKLKIAEVVDPNYKLKLLDISNDERFEGFQDKLNDRIRNRLTMDRYNIYNKIVVMYNNGLNKKNQDGINTVNALIKFVCDKNHNIYKFDKTAKENEFKNEYINHKIDVDNLIEQDVPIINLKIRLNGVKIIINNCIKTFDELDPDDGKSVYNTYLSCMDLIALYNDPIPEDKIQPLLNIIALKTKKGNSTFFNNNILFLSSNAEYQFLTNIDPPIEWDNPIPKLTSNNIQNLHNTTTFIAKDTVEAGRTLLKNPMNFLNLYGGKTHKKNKLNKTYKRNKTRKRNKTHKKNKQNNKRKSKRH